MKANNILIVDDRPNNIEVVGAILSQAGIEHEFALSGAEAIAWLENTDVDLILLDIMMPVMDGYETCSRIKAREEWKDIPIIFLTAKVDPISIEKAFDVGGVDYITKPFHQKELLSRVKTHLDLKHKSERLKNLNEQLEEKVRQRTNELEKALTNLNIAKQELEILDNAKTEFLHMVSHEIRTPLNGIIGGLELLKMNEMPEEWRLYMKMLDTSTLRLEKFAREALDISELQTMGTKVLHRVSVDIVSFLQDIIETSEDSHFIKLKALKDIIIAQTDTVILKKAIDILLENAIKYSLDGAFVTIEADKTEGQIKIAVCDTGEGYPEDMLKSTLSKHPVGIQHEDKQRGLGLTYVKIASEVLDGKLYLENQPDGGAKATIILYEKPMA